MKTVLLLLLAMLAIKTTAVTTASAQDACTKGYTGCLDRCVTRPSKSLQDTCMETCQTQNSACFSQVLGGPGSNAQTVREEPAKPESEVADRPERPGTKAAAPAKPAAKVAAPAKPAKPERKPH
jgi:hypothetical protein